jgi:integrase
LESIVGNTHIRKALGTRDVREAERLKWPEVQRIKAELARLASVDPLTVSAETFRQAIAANPGPDATENENTQREVLLAQAVIRAEQIEEQKGPEAAKQWFTLATTDRKTVGELVDLWLASSSYTEQTRRAHKQAWEGLRKYLGGDCLSEKVDDDAAIAYVETLKLSGASYNTQRRKLNSLVGLWDWLALRKHVARGVNPWRGFRLSNRNSGARESKRPYTDEELLALLNGSPSYPGLRDLMLLGLYTGARLNELCSLERRDVTHRAGAWWLNIRKAKTRAGIRSIAVAHKVPMAILARRHKAAADAHAFIFSEFKAGGYDERQSWNVGKAFGRYRDLRGLPRVVDFHGLRRVLITRLENLAVDQVRIARYVGHEFPSLVAAVYSGGSSEQTSIAVARAITYPSKVEKAAAALLRRKILP